MHLLITGGAGFIGSNLVRTVLSEDMQATVLDDLSTGSAHNLDGLACTFVEGSVLDRVAVSKAMEENVDAIIHLAARPSVSRSIADPIATHHANVTGTLQLLEFAREANVQHFISASSSSVYGLNPAIPKSEREWVRPMSPYAVSKLAGEQYTLAYQESFGFATMAFRFFNVFGPGQSAGHAYAAVIPAFVDAVLRGGRVRLEGDGTQSRDFTYVDTVCRLLLDAAVRRLSHPEPVNLAFGTRTNLLELIAIVERTTGRIADIEYCAPRPGDVKHSQANNNVLQSLFPDIHPVSLDQGMAQTVAWMRSQI